MTGVIAALDLTGVMVAPGVGGGQWLALFATVPGAQIAIAINAKVIRSGEGTSFCFTFGFGL